MELLELLTSRICVAGEGDEEEGIRPDCVLAWARESRLDEVRLLECGGREDPPDSRLPLPDR